MAGTSPSRWRGPTSKPGSVPRRGAAPWAGTRWRWSTCWTGCRRPSAARRVGGRAQPHDRRGAQGPGPKTGLWWEVMDRPPHSGPMLQKQADGSIRLGVAKSDNGNYLEASASCMFTYAIAKGVRLHYLPEADEVDARRGWEGIQKQFITANPDGTLVLHGTVRVGGLGGTPYRAGDFAYYLKEAVVDQDLKGVGAFLLAGSEMDQAVAATSGGANTGLLRSSKDYRAPAQPSSGKIVAMVDAWFNSQTRKNAFGQTELLPLQMERRQRQRVLVFRPRLPPPWCHAGDAACRTHRSGAGPCADLRDCLAGYSSEESESALYGQTQRRRHRGVGQGGRRAAAVLQRPRQHGVHPLRYAGRPLRHPLQSGAFAPRDWP